MGRGRRERDEERVLESIATSPCLGGEPDGNAAGLMGPRPTSLHFFLPRVFLRWGWGACLPLHPPGGRPGTREPALGAGSRGDARGSRAGTVSVTSFFLRRSQVPEEDGLFNNAFFEPACSRAARALGPTGPGHGTRVFCEEREERVDARTPEARGCACRLSCSRERPVDSSESTAPRAIPEESPAAGEPAGAAAWESSAGSAPAGRLRRRSSGRVRSGEGRVLTSTF